MAMGMKIRDLTMLSYTDPVEEDREDSRTRE